MHERAWNAVSDTVRESLAHRIAETEDDAFTLLEQLSTAHQNAERDDLDQRLEQAQEARQGLEALIERTRQAREEETDDRWPAYWNTSLRALGWIRFGLAYAESVDTGQPHPSDSQA